MMRRSLFARIGKLEQITPPEPEREPMSPAEFAEHIQETRRRLLASGYLIETGAGLDMAEGLPLDHDRSLACLVLALDSNLLRVE